MLGSPHFYKKSMYSEKPVFSTTCNIYSALLALAYKMDMGTWISGLRNDMNKRTFNKEQKINKKYIHFLSKQNIEAPLTLGMYVTLHINVCGVHMIEKVSSS